MLASKGISCLAALALAVVAGGPAQAVTCTGNCGYHDGTRDGDIPPAPTSDGSYDWVSTYHGVDGAGSLGSFYTARATNGSELLTNAFHATAGQEISFIYNFVSSDGTAYKDYAFVELINLDTGSATQIINMRYNGAGNTVIQGLGLPPMMGTAGPPLYMYPDAPDWSPLGGSSGSCWFTGCGYTGWNFTSYTIPTGKSGDYALRFGVANWNDKAFDTGLAFSALSLDGVAVGLAPEPASWAMLMAGFFAAGSILRRQRQMTVCA